MTDALDDARVALDSSLQRLMSVCRWLGEHQSDETTDRAWAAFREAKAAADAYALVVHEETVTATCNDVDKAGEILLYGAASETAALYARLGGEKGQENGREG